MYISGADRLAFDFGDCGLRRVSAPQHFWMGKRYGMPQYSWFRYSELAHPERNGNVLDLLWFDDSARDYDVTQLPLDRHYRKAEVMSMRSAWDDPEALIVGFEGGQNRDGGHRHLDLGTYIVEALGVRWAVDPGTEREAYQRHRNKRQRWEFYRLRAEGHNTLVIDPDGGPDQGLDAFAEIVPRVEPNVVSATVDLSAAYAGRARCVTRTLSMVERSYVTVVDHVETDDPAEVWWFMHTEAQVSIARDARSALLRQAGKACEVLVSGHPAARLEVMAAAPLPGSPDPPTQELNPDLHKLAIHLQGVTEVDLTVEIRPRWE
jgi:hypothetical protein